MLEVSRMLSSGASRLEVERLRATATKVRHGVYAETQDDPWCLYHLQCEAVLRAVAGAALAGPSAARRWGLPFVGDPPARVFVRGVTRGRYGRDVKVVSGGTAETIDDRGVNVTSVAWTVADCARIMPRRDALIIADAALHLGLCTIEELEAVAERMARARGIGRVRWIIANADPRAESAGETWTRMVVKDLGYDVRSQVVITEGNLGARVDLLIEGSRVLLEFDGFIKYDPDEHSGEKVARTVVDEKRRHARLEAIGYHPLRVMWEQLFDPPTLDRRIQYATVGVVPRRRSLQPPPGW